MGPKAGPTPVKEPKEKITSNTKVLEDGTGSQWSDISSGPSLATTTATIASIQKSESKIRHQMNLNLKIKNKLNKPDIGSEKIAILETNPDHDITNDDRTETVSLVASLRSGLRSRVQSRAASRAQSIVSDDDTELPDDDTIVQESHATDLMNEAIMMDTILQDIQSQTRKRPKGLLLG